jgi:hypothetical protein
LKNLLVVVLLLTIATPASADGTNWGAVVGVGILGGIIGSAAAPAPQPQIIIVVPPSQPVYAAPQPTYYRRHQHNLSQGPLWGIRRHQYKPQPAPMYRRHQHNGSGGAAHPCAGILTCKPAPLRGRIRV